MLDKVRRIAADAQLRANFFSSQNLNLGIFMNYPASYGFHISTGSPRWRKASAALVIAGLLLTGCATNQQTGGSVGAVGGGLLGALAGSAGGGKNRDARMALGAAVGAGLGFLAGSAIGARLDEADQARLEAASQRAMMERELAIQRQINQRNAQIEQQLRSEITAARSERQRAEAERRAAQARATVPQQVAAAPAAAPVIQWRGNASGSSQALGQTQVAGRSECEQVREVAIIRGQEVKQTATYCADPNGGKSRVA